MKKVLFVSLISVFAFFLSQAQSTWQIVNSPVIEDFVSLSFMDAEHGWIVSENGTLIETSDGGYSWTTYYPFPGIHINSIYFSDDNHGCMVGYFEADSSLIAVTHDGGNNWLWGEHERVNRLNDVFFINNNIGWAVGAQGGPNMNCCYYTSDGGDTWSYQSSILVAGAELFGVHFRDEDIGQICGFDGVFFNTNDGGSNWALNVATLLPFLNLNAIFNWGVLTGCMVGEEGIALYTTNNWYQYIETVTNTTENLNGVSGDPATNKLWAAGDNGTIIYTPSYLLGWTAQPTGVTENLNDIQMLSETVGWTVGDNGTILHFSPATTILQNEEKQITIYPNPVNDFLAVEQLNKNKFQSLELMDSKGKLLQKRNLLNHKTTTLDVSKYFPGLYFLKVSTESNFIIEKLIIQ